jgi:MFS family permease
MALGFLAVAGMGLAPVWPLALLATAVAGFTATWCGVSLQAAIQTDLPDAYRGRVMSLWTVVGFGTVAIGAGLIGGLAEVVGSAPRWWRRLSRAGRHGLWRFGGARG